MFCNFCENFENSKWPPFLMGQNFFENWVSYSADLLPCGQKISSKSLYLAQFRDTSIFVFCIFKKNSKIQHDCHFSQVKYSLKLEKASLHRYPVGQKFCRKLSISHSFRDTSTFVLCDFCKKIQKFKMVSTAYSCQI